MTIYYLQIISANVHYISNLASFLQNMFPCKLQTILVSESLVKSRISNLAQHVRLSKWRMLSKQMIVGLSEKINDC